MASTSRSICTGTVHHTTRCRAQPLPSCLPPLLPYCLQLRIGTTVRSCLPHSHWPILTHRLRSFLTTPRISRKHVRTVLPQCAYHASLLLSQRWRSHVRRTRHLSTPL